MLNKERVEKLQAIAVEESLAAFVIVPSASLVYFTGFAVGMSERPTFLIVPREGQVSFFCPTFEQEKVRRYTGIENLITYTDEEGAAAALIRALADWDLGKKVAFEYTACRLIEHDVFRQALKDEIEMVDARPLVARLRMAKDSEEFEYMKTAATAADLMVGAIEKNLRPGITELQLAALATEALLEAYPDADIPFLSIASGEHTCLPHAVTGERAIEEGDLVWVDLGANIKGYVSDITRTFALGPLDEELSKAYDLVLAANRAACAAAAPGVTAEYLDQVARKVITDGGFGPYFTHRTGHGIGLEVHEEPYIVEGNTTVLKPGYAFTIEPGIYLPGKGGIRIEDDVIITEDGAEIITKYPRDLRR